jgi:prepilin-type N-terminal cleavage/methylation domain-containing protein
MKRPAFTLIELLITIAIIGVLTGLASVSYAGIQKRSRDAQRKNDLSLVKIYLSTYYNAQVPPQYVSSVTQNTAKHSAYLVSTNQMCWRIVGSNLRRRNFPSIFTLFRSV